MKLRNTIILIVVALLLGGYVYFFEIKGDKEGETSAGDAAITMIDVSLDEVVELVVRDGPATMRVFLSEDGRTWMLDQPEKTEADADQVRRAIAHIVGATASLSLDRKEAGNLADFGLENRAVEVTVRTSDGDAVVLLVGERNPRGTQYYAMMAHGNAIYMIDRDVVDIARKLVSEPPYRPTPLLTPTSMPAGN